MVGIFDCLLSFVVIFYFNTHRLNHTTTIVYFAFIVPFQFKRLVLVASLIGILSIRPFIVDKNSQKLCGTYESLIQIYFVKDQLMTNNWCGSIS